MLCCLQRKFEASVLQKAGPRQQLSVAVGSPVDARAEHAWHAGGRRVSRDTVVQLLSRELLSHLMENVAFDSSSRAVSLYVHFMHSSTSQ